MCVAGGGGGGCIPMGLSNPWARQRLSCVSVWLGLGAEAVILALTHNSLSVAVHSGYMIA